MVNSTPPPAGPRAQVSRKAVDLAKNLLSAMFMAIRTAKIHDPSNAAFDTAVQTVFRSAEALFQATGGFSLQFVEDTIFLNGSRLRLESSAFSTMRTLRRMMEAEGLGGLELTHPPRLPAIQKLVLMFAPGADNDAAARAELSQDVRMLGVQRLQDERKDIKVDRRVFAVQCYGKLVLAVREQLDRIAQARACDWSQTSGPPRLRIVRVVQDLVELGQDRADFLLRLSTNHHGASDVELHGANTCLLTIVMGHALGSERQELVDVAVAALFHHIGAPVDPQGSFTWTPNAAHASLARLLAESGAGTSSYLRALLIGELPMRAPESAPIRAHPFARLIKVAATYDRLVTGFGGGERLHPVGALARLYNTDPADIDRDLVDLLINVLRAFPVGARVVLDGGEVAEVVNQLGGARWDRPLVRVEGASARVVDLALRDGGRCVGRIPGTARVLGHDTRAEGPLDESAVPVERETSSLDALLEGEDVLPDELPPLELPEDAGPLDDASAGELGPLELPEDALFEADPDATIEGPSEALAPGISSLASDLDLDDGFAPDTQPALQGLASLEPLAPLGATDDGLEAATIVSPSLFEQDPAFDEARIDMLERLDDRHGPDTFDEDDDTRSE